MGESLYLAMQGFIILPTMKSFIVLALYILDVTLCLIQIKKNRPYAYMATKPLLMPLLCAVYYAFLPEHLSALPHQKYVAIALMLHTAGDIFLLFPRSKTKHMFYLGMLSFFLGHIYYSMWFIKAPVGHNRNAAIMVFLICLTIEYLIYRQLMLGPRKYAPMLLPYSFGLCFLATSIAYTMGQGSPVYATLISQVGIALFFFSDFCIMRRMVRLPLFGQMTVMSTYIAGQSLIVLGMLLMQL